MTDSRHYKAFISYSHSDEQWARWLQSALEKYRPPKSLFVAHPDLPKRLFPIFRDRDELASGGELSESIHKAMQESDALIVICSPAARASMWVNEEIKHFKASDRGHRVFCFLVAGSPDAHEPDCAFPTAILQDEQGNVIHEPLAADATPKGDGKRNAMLKIAAGLLDVGVDELKRRDAQRQTRFWASIAIGSIFIATLTIGLAVYALYAKRESEIRRQQAENLIGYMLGDLRKNLEPIGKLKLLDSIGNQAMSYFEAIGEQGTEKEMLERAKALKQIGDVRFKQGKLEPALTSFRKALKQSKALYDSDPKNNDYLYELGQAEFWVGYVAWERGKLDVAEAAMQNYLTYSLELKNREPSNFDYTMELTYAYSNMGSLARAKGNSEKALEYFQISNILTEAELALKPNDEDLTLSLAEGYSWIGSTELDLGHLKLSELAFEKVSSLLEPIHAEGRNARASDLLGRNMIFLAETNMFLNKTEQAILLNNKASEIYEHLVELDTQNAGWLRTAIKATIVSLSIIAPKDWTIENSQSAKSAQLKIDKLRSKDASSNFTIQQKAVIERLMALEALAKNDLTAAQLLIQSSYQTIESATTNQQDQVTFEILARIAESYGTILNAQGKTNEAKMLWQKTLNRITTNSSTTFTIKPISYLLAKNLGLTKIETEIAAELKQAGYQDIRMTSAYTLSGNIR